MKGVIMKLLQRLVKEIHKLTGPKPKPLKSTVMFLQENGKRGVFVGELFVNPDSPGGTGTLVAVGASGRQTSFDDVPQWTNSNEAVVTLEVAEDGASARWSLVGDRGSAVLTAVTVESNTGKQFEAVGTITVSPEDVESVSMELTEDPHVEARA